MWTCNICFLYNPRYMVTGRYPILVMSRYRYIIYSYGISVYGNGLVSYVVTDRYCTW